MDSKHQQNVKKQHGGDQQLGKENKGHDVAAKDFATEGKQHDFGKDVHQKGQGSDMHQRGKDFGKDVKQQGLGAESDVNRNVGGKQKQDFQGGKKELGKDFGGEQQQDLGARGKDLQGGKKGLGKEVHGQQKQGQQEDLQGGQKHLGKDIKGGKVSPGDDIPIKGEKDFGKGGEQKLGVGDKETLRQQEFPDSKNDITLKDCSCCGRHFFADRVAKHEKACEKAHQEREQFDSREQRLEGLEIGDKASKQVHAEPKVSSSSWKQTHDDFLKEIRSSKSKKGKREDKWDLDVKVPARMQQRLGKEGQQKEFQQGGQQKDLKQDIKQKDIKQQGHQQKDLKQGKQQDVKQQDLEVNQQKGGLAEKDTSLGEEAHIGGKKGKIASDSQQPSRQSYNQPTR